MDFEEIWQDIINNFHEGEVVYTLSQKVPNKILYVGSDSLKVKSEKTGKVRKIKKEDFKPFVDSLLRNRSLDFMHDLSEKDWIFKGAIIIVILAKLDYIDYETRPRRLFEE